MNRTQGTLWAIVLAGGEGRRLTSVTRLLYGEDLPKQFAVLDGKRSLLQATMDRLRHLVPPDRTVVVVAQEHALAARVQLASFPGVDLVLQPRNLGTGPGVLLALARILVRDPFASVAVFPSDHHVSNPHHLADVVRAAGDVTGRGQARLALIGAVPVRAETDYGWIVPGERLNSRHPSRTIRRFIEKPGPSLASQLFEAGALWNTFILASRLVDLWTILHDHLPRHTPLFEAYASQVGHRYEGHFLDRLYADMEPADFSRDVLEKATGLAVVPLEGCDWSDLGTPDRLLDSLRGRPFHGELVARLREAVTARGDHDVSDGQTPAWLVDAGVDLLSPACPSASSARGTESLELGTP